MGSQINQGCSAPSSALSGLLASQCISELRRPPSNISMRYPLEEVPGEEFPLDTYWPWDRWISRKDTRSSELGMLDDGHLQGRLPEVEEDGRELNLRERLIKNSPGV